MSSRVFKNKYHNSDIIETLLQSAFFMLKLKKKKWGDAQKESIDNRIPISLTFFCVFLFPHINIIFVRIKKRQIKRSSDCLF